MGGRDGDGKIFFFKQKRAYELLRSLVGSEMCIGDGAYAAGMPVIILDAYGRFQEGVAVHNTIAGGVGTGFKRRCGIPQGCPLSMMFTALLMRPWILMTKQMGACPRILADDILLLVPGKGMIKKFARSLTYTRDYLIDMGAKIAEGKSLNVASTKAARKWITATLWEKAGGAISVVEHLRYLGGHLTTTAKRHHGTLIQRGIVGQHMAARAGRLPAARPQQPPIIRVQVMTAACYGSEFTATAHKE